MSGITYHKEKYNFYSNFNEFSIQMFNIERQSAYASNTDL